jgi:hypothetical protein
MEQTPTPTTETEVAYKYQSIVNASQPLTVKRKVDANVIKQLAEKLIALDGKAEIEWTYVCSPPDRIKREGDNAPAYVPAEPNSSNLAEWLLFQGYDALVADTHARQCSRSRAHDRDCRSNNFEKFDDETFCKLQSEGPDRTPIKELKANLDAYMKAVMVDKVDPDTGLPIDMSKLPIYFAKLAELQAKIESRKRTTED